MTDPQAWGVDLGYNDYRRRWHEAPRETVGAILEAMGATRREHPPAPPAWVVRRGEDVRADGTWELLLEDGGSERLEGRLPADLPEGYHRLRGDDREVRLIVTPPTCHLPPGLRTWGWALQLYALRSTGSCGIGDLGDLRRFARWSAGLGAGMVLVNPLHASLPTVQQASPYYPSSRCFRNPIYLRVDGAGGAELNARRVIDRDAVWAAKSEALERRWRARPDDDGFRRYLDEGGEALRGYATFCALSEEHGTPWTSWPRELRHPDSPAVASFAQQHEERVRYHAWLQWLVDSQLAAVSAELPVMQDLAIGCDPAGADAWLWQDSFALGMRVGAPPDEFNTRGQDWGLPPFDPWRLRAAAYEPFIQTVRAGLRHAGGIRIDHVMGLFRLYWIPEGADPSAGTYVRYPWEDLLGILALESRRAGAYVVGEDLGTVEDYMREELHRRSVLSYRLLWFERDPPERFPEQALAAVTTHDLPTVAGLWSGADLQEQDELGLEPNAEATQEISARLAAWCGLPDGAPARDVVVGTYRLLARAPSMLLTATLDDALLVEERPNVPGTTDERPNWSLALPKPLEEIEEDPVVLEVARALRGRAGPSR